MCEPFKSIFKQSDTSLASYHQAPKHPSTQAPKLPSTQAPKHSSTQAPKHPSTQAPKHPSTQVIFTQLAFFPFNFTNNCYNTFMLRNFISVENKRYFLALEFLSLT